MKAVNILVALGGYFALLLATSVLLRITIPQFAGMTAALSSFFVLLLLTEIAIRAVLIATGLSCPAYLSDVRKLAVGLANLVSALLVALSGLIAWQQTGSQWMALGVIVTGALLLAALNAGYSFSRAKPS